MTDIIVEILRAIVVGGIIIALFKKQKVQQAVNKKDWRILSAGFGLIFFGTLMDITDNFEQLNKYVIVGNTEFQTFLEKVVGYHCGFLLLALGVWQWLPKLIEYGKLREKQLEVQEERLKVLHATMRTVQDIVNNCLNGLQLFRFEAEETKALNPESIALMDSVINETSNKLRCLGNLDSTPEKKMAAGVGIDYEAHFEQYCYAQNNESAVKLKDKSI